LQRYVEAKHVGGLEIDHELELDWGLDGKLARLRALEDAIGIGRRAPKIIKPVISVGQQAATPIRRTPSGCCARAASGQATAAPPRTVINSRRFK